MLEIPTNVSKILKTLEDAGFEGYIVGGCVRDLLLGSSPNDFDITTNALPEQIKSLFIKTVDTGIKHGTVTVIDADGTPFEITTYRTESGYDDMRHPKNVEFVSDIKEDLSRRDFTVNAMALNGSLVDFFGGRDDLNKKILRAVGNPQLRFTEDALRILRLFRFSSTLMFKIERKTYKSALKLCKNLEKISGERVSSELIKTLCGKNPNVLKPLINKGGLKSFGIEKCKSLKNISKLKSEEKIRLFAFLKSVRCDGPEVIKKLKLSNAHKNYYLDMEKLLFLNRKSSPAEIKLALSLADTETVFDMMDFKTFILDEDLSGLKPKTEKILKSAEPYKISHLKISGEDLKKAGLKDKQIGQTLSLLLETVREHPEKNTKQALLDIVNK